MAIRKPLSLHNWLLRLNFTIFTWQLNIGDWLESSLDWVVSWVNEAWQWAEIAYNWGRAAWDRAAELYNITKADINRLAGQVQSRFESLWYTLDTWWAARKWELQEWVRAHLSTLQLLFNDLTTTFQRLNTAWESFRRDTLPRLIDLTWWSSFWGGMYASIGDWWSPRRQQIREETETQVSPIRDEVNRHSSWLDMIKKLFTDPEEFILELLVRVW